MNIIWLFLWLGLGLIGWRVTFDGGRRHSRYLGRAADDCVLPVADHGLLCRAALPGLDHLGGRHDCPIWIRALSAWIAAADRHRANADVFANGYGDFIIPIQEILGLVLPPDDFANVPIEGTSQFTVLLGFIFVIFISLALAAGGIAVFFYLAHRGVRTVQEIEPTDGDRTQIVPIREAGKVAGGVVGIIRAIPRVIGYQK